MELMQCVSMEIFFSFFLNRILFTLKLTLSIFVSQKIICMWKVLRVDEFLAGFVSVVSLGSRHSSIAKRYTQLSRFHFVRKCNKMPLRWRAEGEKSYSCLSFYQYYFGTVKWHARTHVTLPFLSSFFFSRFRFQWHLNTHEDESIQSVFTVFGLGKFKWCAHHTHITRARETFAWRTTRLTETDWR